MSDAHVSRTHQLWSLGSQTPPAPQASPHLSQPPDLMLLLGPDVFSEWSSKPGALAGVLQELGGCLKLRCPGKGQGTGCGLQGQQGEWPH